MRNVPIQPTLTSVASVTGQLPLVANIDAVPGKQTYIWGIDVSYSEANSQAQVTIEDGGDVIWASMVNQVLHVDFGSAPLQTSEASSIQSVCASGPSGVEARATLRYTRSSP